MSFCGQLWYVGVVSKCLAFATVFMALALLGCYAARFGSLLSTFRESLSVPSSKAKHSKQHTLLNVPQKRRLRRKHGILQLCSCFTSCTFALDMNNTYFQTNPLTRVKGQAVPRRLLNPRRRVRYFVRNVGKYQLTVRNIKGAESLLCFSL
jgi:hypothetical protein